MEPDMRKLAFVLGAVVVVSMIIMAAAAIEPSTVLAAVPFADPHSFLMAVPAAIVTLREKQTKLVVDARAKMEEIKDDTPEARAKEIETEYDAMMVEYDRIETEAKTLEAREAKRQQLEDRQRESEERNAAIEEAQSPRSAPSDRQRHRRSGTGRREGHPRPQGGVRLLSAVRP
jgi:hypothetical protein